MKLQAGTGCKVPLLLGGLASRSLPARSEILAALTVDVLLAVVGLQLAEDHVESAVVVENAAGVDAGLPNQSPRGQWTTVDCAERHVLSGPGLCERRSHLRSEISKLIRREYGPIRFGACVRIHEADLQRPERIGDRFHTQLGGVIARCRSRIILRLDLHPLVIVRPKHD